MGNEPFEYVKQFYLTPTRRLHDISFKGKICVFLRNVDNQKICGIYNSRFITCRMYPFSFSALPDGELLVNIVHCNGVSLDQGELVTEEFVKRILDDLNWIDKSFLCDFITLQKDHHAGLLPFFTFQDIAEFRTKRYFLDKVAQWIVHSYSRDKSIDVRIRAVAEILTGFMRNNLTQLARKISTAPPLLITLSDARNFASEIKKELETKLISTGEEFELLKQKDLQKILLEKKVEILVDQKPRIFQIDEEISYTTPYLDKLKVRVESVVSEKPLSNDAIQLLEEFIIEICSRIGHGGFTMNIPIIDVLQTLHRFSQDLMSHARAYSQENNLIEKSHIHDAIVYLDSRNALGVTCAEVINEYKQSISNTYK